MTSEERREARYKRRVEKRRIKKIADRSEADDFNRCFSYDNLYAAYRKCRRNVGWKASTQKFITQAPLEVYRLHTRLMDGTWKSKGFYEFDLCERGKLRHIKSVDISERVVQRCLCDNALIPVLAPTLIYDNGASSKGKGYHFAIDRCEKHLQDHYRKYGQDGYILLFDFKKFFDNISHQLCWEIVNSHFQDDWLKGFIMMLVDAFGDVGLGLGSQISQTFALASANKLDHFVKERLCIHGYGRYMDDGYLISRSKLELQRCLDCIRVICQELGITINESKTHITRLSKGFTFLKCRFYLTENGKVVKKIYKKSVTKMRRKLKSFRRLVDEGVMTYEDVYQAYQSWRSYAAHFDAWHTIKTMDRLYNQLFIGPYI